MKNESDYYYFNQHVTMCPSSDEKSVIMVANTRTVIITEETSDAFMPCADNSKHIKIKCCSMNNM